MRPMNHASRQLCGDAGAQPVPPMNQRTASSWQRSPAANTPLFTTIAVPQHPGNSPAVNNLFHDSWLELIKNRIVIVSATIRSRSAYDTTSVIDGRRCQAC